MGKTNTQIPKVEDTGENGLYQKMLEGEPWTEDFVDKRLTKISTEYLSFTFTSTNPVVGVFENVTELARSPFRYCTFKRLYLPNVTVASGIFERFTAEHLSLPKLIKTEPRMFYKANFQHLILPSVTVVDAQTFESVTQLQTVSFGKQTNKFNTFTFVYGDENLVAIVIRNPSAVPTLANTNGMASTVPKYVPKDLLTTYEQSTNWIALSNFIGIDEDITIVKGQTFTPSYGGSSVVSWDKIDLQSYAVATVDQNTGVTSTFDDGCILVRGLDSNDVPIYVAHLEILEA